LIMKKIILLVISTLLLITCNSGLYGIEIYSDTDMQKFTFIEDEFKKTYEENIDKVVSNSFKFNHSSTHIDNINANQVKMILQIAYDLLGDDVIKKMIKSFKEDRDELIKEEDMTSLEEEGKWRKVESGDRLFVDYGISEDDTYVSAINLYLEEGDG